MLAESLDSPNLPALWIIVSICLHAVVSLGVGLFLYYQRRRDGEINDRLAGHDRRIGGVEARLQATTIEAVIVDKDIQIRMAERLVPREECAAARRDFSEKLTRVFTKIEDLQKGQSAVDAKCKTILEIVRQEKTPDA